ncbi:hypothetical protein [Paenibacillus methanolicus]|uniref:Uncharacterized protein n=1 Tax=Paenibacillus methanolicus TaxID=582686 RepID=A0A5S5BWY4_9BACL|nr:hypothetical protein [Paenibacillus methanolicus]TYP70650.1 hypothetical protein BCM02_111156 [Paenibacillus methanolicus]
MANNGNHVKQAADAVANNGNRGKQATVTVAAALTARNFNATNDSCGERPRWTAKGESRVPGDGMRLFSVCAVAEIGLRTRLLGRRVPGQKMIDA